MLLDVLKDFEWLNEPRKLAYSDAGMAISTEAQTGISFLRHGTETSL